MIHLAILGLIPYLIGCFGGKGEKCEMIWDESVSDPRFWFKIYMLPGDFDSVDDCIVVQDEIGGLDAVASSDTLFSLDDDGTILWQKQIRVNPLRQTITDLVHTDQGHVVILGNGRTPDASSEICSIWLIDMDENGASVAAKEYIIPQNSAAYYLEKTPDHGYVVGGLIFSAEQEYDIFIFKVDGQLNQEWMKRIGSGERSEGPLGILPLSSGSYYVAGMITMFNEEYGDDSYERMLLIRLDAEGNILWQKTTPTDTLFDIPRTGAFSAFEAVDGDVVVAGLIDEPGDAMGDKTWIMSLDEGGIQKWQKQYVGLEMRDIAMSEDGGFVLAGRSNGIETTQDVLVARVDASGNVLWCRSYGGPHDEYVKSVSHGPNGGFVIGGDMDLCDEYESKMFIMNIDEDGIISDGCSPDVGMRLDMTVENADIVLEDALLTQSDISMTQGDLSFETRDMPYEVFTLCAR